MRYGPYTIRITPIMIAAIAAAVAVVGVTIAVYFFGAFLSAPACVNDPNTSSVVPIGPDGRPANYLHTCGSRIYDARGREARITGINWFGMETETAAPHGLWLRSYKSMLDQIVVLGYNAVRLPYSNEALDPGRLPQGISYDRNPDLQGLTSLEVMDKLVAGARERGLKVILDRHRPTSQGQSSLWYTTEITEERWIQDWRMLAQRYFGDDTVIGADLHNEPKGEATWGSGDLATDWRLAAERAGNAILEVNPNLLIFVQGVDRMENDYYWWGGNLAGVSRNPVRLQVPNRLVYAPHDYGPDVFLQGWFYDPAFPRNLPQVWDKYWGYIHKRGIAPVVVGEFGGRSVGSDAEGLWQQALLSYLQQNRIGFFNWTLNPNSSDTGGLLEDDWLTVVQEKQDLYQRYLAPLIGSTGPPKASANKFHVLYHPAEIRDETNTIGIRLQIVNDNPAPIPYSRLEVRYWYTAGQLRGRSQELNVDYASMGEPYVKGRFVPTSIGGQDYYLSITFDEKAGTLDPYSSSSEMIMRIHKSDWSTYDQTNDYSYAPFTEFQQWERVTLYFDGQLIWGAQP
ncbi:MAG: cellulase family glycosylhydrolase [Chloroflexi bacterium]|nr:cellulase family glycosylhydrolase [Chloroflexota bacterium]